MVRKNKAFLLIEVIVALSIFALLAGAITQGFLTGMKMRSSVEVRDESNEAVITNMLINKIEKTSLPPASKPIKVSIPLEGEKKDQEDTWQLVVKESKKIFASNNLYALKVEISKTPSSPGETPKVYNIFRYIKP